MRHHQRNLRLVFVATRGPVSVARWYTFARVRVVEQGLKVVAAMQPWCAQVVLVGAPYGDKPDSSRGGVVVQGTCRMQVPGSKPL